MARVQTADQPHPAPAPATTPDDSLATVAARNSCMGLRFAIVAVVFVVVSTLGLIVGPHPIAPGDIFDALTGRVDEPLVEMILFTIRIPRTITALMVGAALGISGLMMQTLFRNPLADPYILGVSSGASLGVAVVVLMAGVSARAATFTTGLGMTGDVGIIVAAAVGAGAVMTLVLFIGRFLKSTITLLLLGVMMGYFVSAAVTVMLSAASPEMVQQYMTWGFGSYHGVSWNNLRVLVPVLLVALLISLVMSKWLNALLLGDNYAQTMGINLQRVRTTLVLITALLAGGATAFCGPIGFLGIAIPHLCRGIFGTSDHRVLLPGCVLVGGSLALLADVCSQLPGQSVLPLNAVNAAFGAPVVIFILVRRNKGLTT